MQGTFLCLLSVEYDHVIGTSFARYRSCLHYPLWIPSYPIGSLIRSSSYRIYMQADVSGEVRYQELFLR